MQATAKKAFLLFSLFFFCHRVDAKAVSFSSAELKKHIEKGSYTEIFAKMCNEVAVNNCHAGISTFETLEPQDRELFSTIKLIGSGGFGNVYKIDDRHAVKVVNVKSTDGSLSSVLHEINIGLKINEGKHAHLVPVLDCCVETTPVLLTSHKNYKFFIGMPFYPMGTLLDFMRNPDNTDVIMTADWKWSIINGVILGLKDLHLAEYTHRDIKPDNILMESAYVPRIADFGQAKKLFNKMTDTRLGATEYTAPEILANKPYDYKADVYSLGIVIFEVLNALNYRPYLPSVTDIKTYCNGTKVSRYTLERLEWDTYCDDLKNFIFQMIDPNPAHRPTVDELQKQFEAQTENLFRFENRFVDFSTQFEQLKTRNPESEYRKKQNRELKAEVEKRGSAVFLQKK